MNDRPLASRWRRLGGYLLDLLIVGIILYLLMRLTGTVEQLTSEAGMSIGQQLVWTTISLALFVALNGYLLAKDGRTLGKQLVGTRIVDLAGEVPPLGKLIFLRYAIFIFLPLIPILGPIIGLLDSLWIFGREKRCLHDMLAGTKVVFTAASGTFEYVRGLTPAARRILQGAALAAVILVGLIIYRGSLIATGERLEPGTHQLAFLKWDPSVPGGDVYVLDVEQNRVTRVTMNNKIAWMRDWTPDGQKMLLETESGRIPYSLNVNTGEAKRLSDNPVIPGLGKWSPDGQHQIFSVQEEDDADPEIYVAEADGSDQHPLVQNPGADHDPAWSPDGQQVAFWTQLDERWTLSTVNADGTNLEQIAQQPAPFPPITGLHWAPAGSNLFFVSPLEFATWGSIVEAHLFIIDADGQNLIDVGNVYWERWPKWSPDGRMIAFDSYTGRVIGTETNKQPFSLFGCVFSLDADEPDCPYYDGAYPSWSPDGRYLAYARDLYDWGSSSNHICLIEMATGRERCFEEITAGGTLPIWRP